MACENCWGSACSNKEKIEIGEISGEDEATMICNNHKYWPAHPDDPQGIRVASVIEFSVCSLFSVFSPHFF